MKPVYYKSLTVSGLLIALAVNAPAAFAQYGHNPAGSTATINGQTFNGQTLASSGFDGFGYKNDGTLFVIQGQFNNDHNGGLWNDGTATVTGGQFNNNLSFGTGLVNILGGTLTVTAGQFKNDEIGINNDGSTAVIAGGMFENNTGIGLGSRHGTTYLLGGKFSGNALDLLPGIDGEILVYGTFTQYGALSGSGSFSGTLADGEQETLTYSTFQNGLVDLLPVSAIPPNLRGLLPSNVPEPGTYALLSSLGLTGAAFLRRKRSN